MAHNFDLVSVFGPLSPCGIILLTVFIVNHIVSIYIWYGLVCNLMTVSAANQHCREASHMQERPQKDKQLTTSCGEIQGRYCIVHATVQ